jgi:hypothetical protein
MNYSIPSLVLVSVFALSACTGPMGSQGDAGTGTGTIVVVPAVR